MTALVFSARLVKNFAARIVSPDDLSRSSRQVKSTNLSFIQGQVTPVFHYPFHWLKTHVFPRPQRKKKPH